MQRIVPAVALILWFWLLHATDFLHATDDFRFGPIVSTFDGILGAVLVFVAAMGAYLLATRSVSGAVAHALALAIFLVSNAIVAWPYYTSDPATWIITYTSAILWAVMLGHPTIVYHVAPFYIVYYLTHLVVRLGNRRSLGEEVSSHNS